MHRIQGIVATQAFLMLIGGLLLGGLCGAAQAELLRVHLAYPQQTVTVTQGDDFSDVRLIGGAQLLACGKPALPVSGEQVVLPAGMRAQNVQAISTASVRIPCRSPRPAQPPAILGPLGQLLPPPTIVPADPDVYEGDALYPLELAILRGTGHLGRLNIASCEVHPVQFDPGSGELILHTGITLTFELTTDSPGRAAHGGPREMDRIACELAQQDMHGAGNLATEWEGGQALQLDPGSFQYVIVTESGQLAAYEEYAAWKTAKGVPATVVTVEWIDGSFPGRDLAEKIRNFIIDAVAEWGVSYVLLGGDEHIVPSRISWAFDCEAGFYPDENDLYADLYYSDLDGTWDANGNDIFGEVADEVDLYPDILVGRAPSDDLEDAQALVAKFLTYERTPPTGHMMEAFFFAEILWSDPYTDSGIGKDMIADRHFGDAYEPIERQYESLGNESPSSVINHLNWGPHLTNHGGHANYQLMGCGDGYMDRDDVDGLHNAPHYFVLYSIGCWAAAFDYGCIGERFVENPNGGAIAFIGNSRYGWGSPGNPGWGYSETFDSDFYGTLLSWDMPQFGAAVARPKILRVPYAQDGNVYRWHEYQVNLLGDPEMTCHTAAISTLALAAPDVIPIGNAQFTATVSDPDGLVEGSRVCLAGPDVYLVGFSDASGQVVFATEIAAAQELALTATAANHPYAERTIIAAGEEPFLTVTAAVINEDAQAPSAGNGDGEIGPGETVELYVTVHNYGGSATTGVTGTLSVSSPYATVIEAQISYDTVASGGEATNAAPFVFEILSSCPPGEMIAFTLQLEDDGAGSWSEVVPLAVVAPGPSVQRYTADEVIGDGDGVIEPGETAALTVYVVNTGSGNLGTLTAALTTSDPNLVVVQGASALNIGLDPGQAAALSPAFEVRVESGSPSPGYGALDIAFTHGEGIDTDAFLLAIGEVGFTDDMEDGPGGWTHSGTNDEWHLSDHRQHSGQYSWYCGSAGHQYANNTDASLVSAIFVAPEDAELAFWCYYDVTIYGVDGLFVELWQDGGWETLEYLGSGGALDSTLFVCDWAEHTYALGGLEPGCTTQIRFHFITDNTDVAEGFYIDDVCMRSAGGDLSAVDQLPIQIALALSPACPNPTRTGARWQLALPEPAPVSAHVYDPSGRLVRMLLRRTLDAGLHEIAWDGTNTCGAATPGGVYFLQLRAGNGQAVRKLIRLSR